MFDAKALLRPLRLAAAALLLSACGTPCERLSVALCDGGDAAYCAKVDEWLKARLIDPQTKEPLTADTRDQMCTAIYGSVDIFNAYRFKAKQKLLGEPDFTVASSTPAANKADVTPPTPPSKAALAKPDEAKAEEPKAEPDEPIKADDRPDDGEEDKPGQNMSD